MINRVSTQKESWNMFYNNWLSVTDEKYKSIVSKSDVYLALECCNRYVILPYYILYYTYYTYRTVHTYMHYIYKLLKIYTTYTIYTLNT